MHREEQEKANGQAAQAALKLVIVLVAVVFAAVPASGAEDGSVPGKVPTLAVLNFANRNPGDGWDWLEKGMADMLITDLSASARLQLVSRERMQSLFDELKLQKKLAMKNGSVQEFGRVAKATYVLTGTFWVKGRQLTIQSHIAEVATGELARLEEVAGSAKQVLTLEKQLALAIVKNLDVPLTAKEKKALLRLPARSIDAVREFYRGIDHLDKKRPYDALAAFRSATRTDKSYDEAYVRAAQTYESLKEFQHAAIEYRRLLKERPDSPLEPDALYCLGRLCLDRLNRAAEAELCFRALWLRPGVPRFRTVRAFSSLELGRVSRKELPRILVAEALARQDEFEDALAIYMELWPPAATAKYLYSVGSPLESRAVQKRFLSCIRRATQVTGQVPELPYGLIMLDPKNPVYEEGANPKKGMKDLFGRKRTRGGPYYIAVKGPHCIRKLHVTVNTAARGWAYVKSKIVVGRVVISGNHFERAKYDRDLRPGRETRTAIIPYSDNTQLIQLHVRCNKKLFKSWRLRAELAPYVHHGTVRVETDLRKALVYFDGHYVGRSPVTVRLVRPGRHTVRASVGSAAGTIESEPTTVIVKEKAQSEVVLRLTKLATRLPGWAAPEIVTRHASPLPSRGPLQADVLFYPDNSAVAFTVQNGDIMMVRSPKPGKWALPVRLPEQVNTKGIEAIPRCLLAADKSIVLVWCLKQSGKYHVRASTSRDGGRSWSASKQVSKPARTVGDLQIAYGPEGKSYIIFGDVFQEFTVDGPVGQSRRLNVSHKNYSTRTLFFDKKGAAHVFSAATHASSKDLINWTTADPSKQGANSPIGKWCLGGFVTNDDQIVILHYTAWREKVLLTSTPDGKTWKVRTQLSLRVAPLIRVQANGLPVACWQSGGGHLIISRATSNKW